MEDRFIVGKKITIDCPSDYGQIQKIVSFWNNPKISDYLGKNFPFTKTKRPEWPMDTARNIIKNFSEEGWFFDGIIKKNSNKLIGFVLLKIPRNPVEKLNLFISHIALGNETATLYSDYCFASYSECIKVDIDIFVSKKTDIMHLRKEIYREKNKEYVVHGNWLGSEIH